MMAAVMGTFLVIILIIVMVLLISCVKIVRQAQALVIERLGAYQATWGTGLHFKLPIVDRVARRVDMKEQVVDFAPQPVITKDNVTMRIDTVVFYQITDPKMFCYGVISDNIYYRRSGAGSDTDFPRNDQYEDAGISGCGNRSMGNQSEPCRA